MADLVYPPVIQAARAAFAGMGLKITLEGTENVPTTGGAVIASNHVGYLDFTLIGWGARPSRRLVRFMAKEAVFRHKVSGPLMRGMHHIPVDREAGSQAFRDAMAALKAGEVVGIFPEATISRSFQLKEFKPGAARMAQAAQVPLVPAIVWGSQRLYTKGRKLDVRRHHVPITVAFGEPLRPAKRDSSEVVTTELIERMTTMLDRIQRSYPERPKGVEDSWWLPASLGGTAPTPEQAAQMDADDRARRGAAAD